MAVELACCEALNGLAAEGAGWQYGTKDEAEEDAQAKQMTRSCFDEVMGWLEEWGVF